MKKFSEKTVLGIKVILALPATLIFLGLLFFLPAGTFNYWHAWITIAVLLIPAGLMGLYLFRYDPELLKRRMRFSEKEKQQKIIIKVSSVIAFLAFLVPGFDFRYGWSNVPFWLVIGADLLVLLGYLIVFLVFRVNSHTSRIIEVEKDQKVISTGPYAVVRHPMYSGVILMYLCLPLGLGSYWSMIFILPMLAIIMMRALNEEKVLQRDLPGYREYCHKVKYRLIPGIW